MGSLGDESALLEALKSLREDFVADSCDAGE
jgi:hypothetical protein